MLQFNFNVRISEIKRGANFTVGQTNVRLKVVGHEVSYLYRDGSAMQPKTWRLSDVTAVLGSQPLI